MGKKQKLLAYAPPTKKQTPPPPTKEQINAMANIFILAQKTQWALDAMPLTFTKELNYFSKLFTSELEKVLNMFYNINEVSKEIRDGAQLDFYDMLDTDKEAFDELYNTQTERRIFIPYILKQLQSMPKAKLSYIAPLLEALKNGEIEVQESK